MKTNRDDVRLKWDAEETFKRIDAQPNGRDDCDDCTGPYTPPSNISAERLASLRHSGPVKKPERNWAALSEAARRPAIGYWEGAPRGMKFSGELRCAQCGQPISYGASCPCRDRNALAPIPDGARGDVWPKWIQEDDARLFRCDSETAGELIFPSTFTRVPASYGTVVSWLKCVRKPATQGTIRFIPQSEAIAWLDANGHKAYADELRGATEFEPIGTMPVVGDRVIPAEESTYGITPSLFPVTLGAWIPCANAWEVGRGYVIDESWIADGAFRILKRQPRKQVEGRVWKGDLYVRAYIGLYMYARANDSTRWFVDGNTPEALEHGSAIELHGPEADAIIRECAKAMGLDHGTR